MEMEMGDRVMVAKGSRARATVNRQRAADLPLALDLCCGAGGFGIALSAAGYRHLGFDSWQPAIDTHLANGLDAKVGDVMTMDWGEWPRQNAPGSVKVSEEEAARLQAFPRVWGAGMTSGVTAGARPRSLGEPIATLTGKGTAYIEHAQGEGRRITPAEYQILQAFPDGFTFTGTSTTVYKQIGNAVPPLLALVVIEANQ